MEYSIAPFGPVWSDGVFNVPAAVADKYIKLASEYQLKALLIILSSNGKSSSAQIAKKLGLTSADVCELMEFWIAEGVVGANGEAAREAVYSAPEKPESGEPEKKAKPKTEISAPTLTPKDIVAAVRGNAEIGELLNEAQSVLGRTISHSEEEMMVNMVNFYGLRPEVVLMILEYCKTLKEKDGSRTIGAAYILKIAQNWMDEGVVTLDDAEEKLKELEKSDREWSEIAALAGIAHKRPTVRQREMIRRWRGDFSIEMISLAIDRMKENTDSPSLGYVDKVLKNWKKKGISTPLDEARDTEEFRKSREKQTEPQRKTGEISRKPTYDIEKIKRDAMNNTDIKY